MTAGTETRTLRVISLGGGVQSSTMLLMAIVGELEGVDAAVFADTGWEPAAVYRHVWWLAEKCAEVGLPMFVATKGSSIRDDLLNPEGRAASIPVFTLDAAGRKGRARRQCTREYKIDPIDKTIRREILGLAPGRSPRGVVVEQLLGISTDESQRMSDPTVGYMRHVYPLIDRGMSRKDCVAWLQSHEFPMPAKSACIGCPFHGNDFWRALKRDAPNEFEDAADFDDRIRMGQKERGRSGHLGLSATAYLHADRIPLRMVDLRTPAERGQHALFDGEAYEGECDTGYCFI